MNTEGQDTGLDEGADIELSLADRWIISALQRTEQEVNEAIQGYRLDQAAQAIYEFIWNDYCDWYLELCKPVLSGDATDAAKRGTRRTLVRVLEALLRLNHPLMPFITEEIWQRAAALAGKSGNTISTQPFPQPQTDKIDAAAESEIAWVKQLLLGIRRIRAEMNISPGKPLPVVLANGSAEDRERVAQNHGFLLNLGRLEALDWLADGDAEPDAAIALVGDMKIMIPMAGLIDKSAELNRLDKEMDKLRKELERGEAKLGNDSFISKAPEPVVAKERERVDGMRASLTQLQEQHERISRL
jgi:valyl-tRNA synthetase